MINFGREIKMPNHGYCKDCWWEQYGKCYFHMTNVSERDYCPDYNRRENNKDTLDYWIRKNKMTMLFKSVNRRRKKPLDL